MSASKEAVKLMVSRRKTRRQADAALDVRIGLLLRQRRLELGMSQAGLADRLGLTFQQVQKYEKGTNQLSVGRLLQVCAALRVPLQYFLGSSAAPEHYDKFDIRLARSLSSISDGPMKRSLFALVRHLSSSG